MTRLREAFPVLATCGYLNSNSTGAFPRDAARVLAEYGEGLMRWRDEAWEDWLAALRRYHAGVERLLGAPAGTVMTDASASALLGRFASCFDYRGARPRVVTTTREFPSTGFLLRAMARFGLELEVVDVERDDLAPEAAIAAALDERTAFVVVSHASFATGALLDLRALSSAAHDVGALLVVDAYQSLGVVPLDVVAEDVDVVLGGAHKWLCGSTELAFMYVRRALLPTLAPAFTGWMASDAPLTFAPRSAYAEDAWRFACGTPLVLPALVSQVGLDLLLGVGVAAIRAHSLECSARIFARCDAEGIAIATPRAPDRRGGIVALRFPGSQAVQQRLLAAGHVTSWRGVLRIAPHIYNTFDEIDACLDALVAERRAAV
ncbi:aminotransferase class V-fold PLP-dependent enzyme [Nannocystis sp. ILAH1]|uniref:aminotransferase class V-fold PLP-dependent enzyme n=1 Tax=unclassified Nannocystis TaxID=2627009 RepID=UPI00226FFD9D|nr:MULTISPECIES: aminotransferase class V-fold PLP-dependent enzyme [unclassified Nannocystis]MCY0992580.1 aminotransferase class V-fold PLP-dependent enzyme [Nannocystis sp. ILAH1]MCY1070194.1 aminotransferase class V-fold PLP-dependent enzyme [Nannocystis sp. RBIL2]